MVNLDVNSALKDNIKIQMHKADVNIVQQGNITRIMLKKIVTLVQVDNIKIQMHKVDVNIVYQVEHNQCLDKLVVIMHQLVSMYLVI
jgi:hypothetical protein